MGKGDYTGLLSGWYLASTTKIDDKYNDGFGIIHSLAQGSYNNWNVHRMDNGVPWCLDNGVFANKFSTEVWLQRMQGMKKYLNTCLFIVIPDVIGNALETTKQFNYYRKMVNDYKVAFVSQDGIRDCKIPWDDFDCLFVGGTNTHKLGEEGKWVIEEAQKRHKWIHIGRVNSSKRMLKFWQADSWDGTHLSWDPSDAHRFYATVMQIREMKKRKDGFCGLV